MKLTKEQIIKCAQEWADYYVDLGWREKVESGELPPWESWYVRDDGIPGYEVNGIRWYPDVSTDEWEFTMDEFAYELQGYAKLRKDFLYEQKPELYDEMIENGILLIHCEQIREAADDREFDLMMEWQAAHQDLMEQDRWEYIRQMNNARSAIEEIVRAEIVFV